MRLLSYYKRQELLLVTLAPLLLHKSCSFQQQRSRYCNRESINSIRYKSICSCNNNSYNNDNNEDDDIPPLPPMEEEEDLSISEQLMVQREQIQNLMNMVKQQAIDLHKMNDRSGNGSITKDFEDDSLVALPSINSLNDSKNNDNDKLKVSDSSSDEEDVDDNAAWRKKANDNVSREPLRAMLFIDGTWLYYALHQRDADRDMLVQNYGMGWQNVYKVNWAELPRIVCDDIEKQLQDKGWSGSSKQPVDIVRASTFTSVRADTDRNSLRIKMFEEMKQANYDVHIMETVGKSEKCVDIALAVEMLHFATSKRPIDIAILLTGDKDFIPACRRVRQKGVQQAVVSLKQGGCNSEWKTTPHVRDFDMIYLDDYVDRLLEKRTNSKALISATTIVKLVFDFISRYDGSEEDVIRKTQATVKKVGSRALGRFLKSLKIGESTVLDEVKSGYGGLRYFVTQFEHYFYILNAQSAFESHFYVCVDIDESETNGSSFEGIPDSDIISEEERQLINQYTLTRKERIPANMFSDDNNDLSKSTPVVIDQVTAEDYSLSTVVDLKEELRNLGLKVSGKKAELIERLVDHINSERIHQAETNESKSIRHKVSTEIKMKTTKKYTEPLAEIITSIIQQEGGSINSRELGRKLAKTRYAGRSALQIIKLSYNSLTGFLAGEGVDYFETSGKLGNSNGFTVALRQFSEDITNLSTPEHVTFETFYTKLSNMASSERSPERLVQIQAFISMLDAMNKAEFEGKVDFFGDEDSNPKLEQRIKRIAMSSGTQPGDVKSMLQVFRRFKSLTGKGTVVFQ